MKTIINLDFETKSAVGFVFVEGKGWLRKDSKNWGVGYAGAAKYSEDPTTNIICFAYCTPNSLPKLWKFGEEPPAIFFEKNIEIRAWNAEFEYWIYTNIAVKRYGFPPIAWHRFVCTMAKARAFSLPGALKNAAHVLHLPEQKADNRAMLALAQPRKFTKSNQSEWHDPISDSDMFEENYAYCKQDVKTEMAVYDVLPEMRRDDFAFYLLHTKINLRGMYVDIPTVQCLIEEFRKCEQHFTRELQDITKGEVMSANQSKELARFCGIESVDKAHVSTYLEAGTLNHAQHRALEIRQALGNSSVKKLFAMERLTSADNRVRGQMIFHGAHTGRSSSTGIQLQNVTSEPVKGWNYERALEAISLAQQGKLFETHGPETLKYISGCLRAMLSAAPGRKLICGDFSAIEAVVLAWLAGEEWRLEVFRTHGMIYEMSAALVTGTPFEEFAEYKKEHGAHHPLRKKVGKVCELALGYAGGMGAMITFGAAEFMTKKKMEENIEKWRKASPAIVNMWYALEKAAINAIKNPGKYFEANKVTYHYDRKCLICTLPSGRSIYYHSPRLRPETIHYECKKTGLQKSFDKQSISFYGWNSNSLKGRPGWMEKNLTAGVLTENVVQAVSNDLLRFSMLTLEKAGYRIVLHVHDEIVSEVDKEFGSHDEFQQLMTQIPDWAEGCPVRVGEIWSGERYRK